MQDTRTRAPEPPPDWLAWLAQVERDQGLVTVCRRCGHAQR